jgi:glucose/arabinose dehydrogenase
MMQGYISIAAIAVLVSATLADAQSLSRLWANAVLEGQAAYGDWKSDTPGVRRHLRASDLPAPYASRSATNDPAVVEKPAEARLSAPPGFEVKLFAEGLEQPRLIRVAPNGDIFVAESGVGRIRVLRPADADDKVSDDKILHRACICHSVLHFIPVAMILNGSTLQTQTPSFDSPIAMATFTPLKGRN